MTMTGTAGPLAGTTAAGGLRSTVHPTARTTEDGA